MYHELVVGFTNGIFYKRNHTAPPPIFFKRITPGVLFHLAENPMEAAQTAVNMQYKYCCAAMGLARTWRAS